MLNRYLQVAVCVTLSASTAAARQPPVRDLGAAAAEAMETGRYDEAIDLYRQQHGEYPAATASSGGSCSGVTGSGALETQQAFADQMTRYTDGIGQSCTLPDAGAFPFGPYIKANDTPANPITNSTVVIIVGAADAASGDLAMGGDGPAGGWKYDVTSGKFIANDTNNDSRGVPFDTY